MTNSSDAKKRKFRPRLLAERAARAGTFGQLLEAYVADLQARGRVTANAVHNSFVRDIQEPHPALWGTLAKSITATDIQLILAKLVDRGLRRGVNLLRLHLHAAFLHSAKADNDPTRLAHAGPVFEIAANPVALVPRKAEFENVGERDLSHEELRRFWHKLNKVDPPIAGDFLRFDLTLGGQRGIQLLRPSWKQYDFDANTVLLTDGKGRGKARDHLLPLMDFALEMLQPLRDSKAEESGPLLAEAESRCTLLPYRKRSNRCGSFWLLRIRKKG
jgi:integrase